MRGFGTDGSPLRTQTSRWLIPAARISTSASPGGRLRVGDVLVAKDVWPAVLVYAHRLHGHNPPMTAAELERLAAGLGLDVVGAAPAEAYAETERHIRERSEREVSSPDMRFTMAKPEVSCHPERLFDGARTVVSAALCYYEPGGAPEPGEARLARYTWRDAYAESCAPHSTSSGAGSAAGIACSSTRTTTSTARLPFAPASRSTARTRWRSRSATGRGSCSARSSRKP